MEKKLQNKEKINDLKKLIELSEDNYREIINILKKYATTLKEAELYIIRYLPYILKDVDERNALLIFKKKLNIYQYYLRYQNESNVSNNIDEVIISELSKMNNNEFIEYVNEHGYSGVYHKLKFLISLYRFIEKDEKLNLSLKEQLLEKIIYSEKYFYNKNVKEEKSELLKNLKSKNDSHFNFVLELINNPKEKWQEMLKEFLNKQSDELVSKNKILRIILLSKMDLSSKEMFRAYKLMENIIDSSITYIKDPVTEKRISQSVYKKTYGRVTRFFELIINTKIEEEDKIIESFSLLSNDKYYGVLSEMLPRLNELFPILYPNFSDYEKFLEERFNIYFEYRKKIKHEVLEKVFEKKKENRKIKNAEKKKIEVENVKKIIKDFINGNYYIIEEYKNIHNIALGDLKHTLEVLSENDSDLYNEFLEKQEKGMEIIKQKTELLLSYLKNGIGSTKREFDVIDYYRIINVEIGALRSMVIKSTTLSNEDIYILVKFLGANLRPTLVDINALLNTVVEINCETDENGNLIQGTGIVIPNEIKEKSIRYLENNDIPLNEITYHNILMKYLKKYYSIEEKSSKKR